MQKEEKGAEEFVRFLSDLKGKGLIIHHWDADGICSARLLLERCADKQLENKTPMLGNYHLTDQELDLYQNYDFVIIADMSLPEQNIRRLADHAKVLIIDHHLGPVVPYVSHYNPIIKGENPEMYPSTSWIISTLLGNQVNLFAVLGVVGDHEQKIQNSQFVFPLISRFCDNSHLSFDQILQMVYLLDSCYKLGDRAMVEQLPQELLQVTDGHSILENKKLRENFVFLESEISKHVNSPGEEREGVIVKRIQTSYNIISTVTRKIAWASDKNTVVVNTGFFTDKDQIYVRSDKNIEPLIQRGKALGFKCGGKQEVFGAVAPKEQTDSFVQEIVKFLHS